MDNNLNFEATQSSNFQIYKDAFAPQPRRTTRAWDRAPVEAHAPRLRGQKIWKKPGIKIPDDKENFETAAAELEKGGIGARKKRRVMGAKENINEGKWQLAEEGGITKAHVVLSPQKKGQNLFTADDTDALLVPRKRTNANHLITPRKPPRRISNGKNVALDAPSSHETIGNTLQQDESSEKSMNGTNNLLSSDLDQVPETTGASEKPEQRMKSLRRSSRRLTQNTPLVAQDTKSNTGRLSSSLSVVIWSAPAFEIFKNAQGTAKTEARTSEGAVSGSSSPREAISSLIGSKVEVSSAKDIPASSPDPSQLSNKDQANASGDDCGQAISPTERKEPIFEDTSLEMCPHNASGNEPTNANEEAPITTPDRTVSIDAPILDPINNQQVATPITKTRTNTPKSRRRSAPQVGSRRSTRTPRAKSFTSLSVASKAGKADMNSQSPTKSLEETSINDPSLAIETTSPLALDESQGTEPVTESTISHEITTLNPGVEITADTTASSGEEDHGPSAVNAIQEDDHAKVDEDAALPATSPANDTSKDLEDASELTTLSSDQTPQLRIEKEVDHDLATETEVEEETKVLGAATDLAVLPPISTSPSRAQPDNDTMDDEIPVVYQPFGESVATEDSTVDDTSISIGMDHIVNLFPAALGDKSEAHPAQMEAAELLEDASEEHETLEALSFSPIKYTEGHSEQEQLDETTSTLTIPSGAVEGEPQESGPRPLVDHDDTDLLRDFVTRVKASRAAKAGTSIPKRKRSLPHSPLRLPLGGEGNSSLSAADPKDDEFDVSAPCPSNKRRKHNDDPSLEEDELAESSSPRRSRRSRVPVKKSVAAPSFIPVRRLGQDGDNTVTLRRSEDKELAALTRINTRKNKGAAVHPTKVLAKKAEEKEDPASRQKALKEVFDQKKKESKKAKTVVWAEELVHFQTLQGIKEVPEPEVEKAKVAEEKKTAVKVGVRSKMSLGMAANGTPAPKRKVRARP